MRLISSSFFGAALVAGALFGAAAPAAAQAAGSIVVVDFSRVYAESLAGKDAQAKLKVIGEAVNKELQPESTALQAEQAALGPRFQGRTQEQILEDLKKDKALATKYEAFIQRGEKYQMLRQLRAQELQATTQKTLSDVLQAAAPDVTAAMTAKNATVVLERREVVSLAPASDISTDVINRFNARVKTIAVAKVDLTKQQQ